MPPAVMQRIERCLGVRIQTSRGMTEFSPLEAINSPIENGLFSGASGSPSIGVHLLLIDAQGTALATTGKTDKLRLRADYESVDV